MKAEKSGNGNSRNTRLHVFLLILAVTLAAVAIAQWSSDNEATTDDPKEFDQGGVRYVITSASESTVRVRGTYANQGSYNLSEVYNPNEDNKRYCVTEISQSAFSSNKTMTSIILGDGLVKIGAQAFSGCINLAEITIPAGVKTLETSVFDGCKNLKKIQSKVDGEVKECDDGVFDLSHIVEVKSYALRNVPCITVTLGKDLKTFEADAIRCATFVGFNISSENPIFTVKNGALLNTVKVSGVDEVNLVRAPTGHKNYVIPEGVVYADLFSLSYLESETLTFPSTYIGTTHYNLTISSLKLKEIIFPEGNEKYKSVDGLWLNKLGTALYLCPAGKEGEIKVPETVEVVGQRAFGNLSGVTIDLSNVKNLRPMAFSEVDIDVLLIPKTMETMTGQSFASCQNIKAMYVHPDNPYFTNWDLSDLGFDFTPAVTVDAPFDYSAYDGAVYSYELDSSGQRVLKSVVVVPSNIHQPNRDNIKEDKSLDNRTFVIPSTVYTIGNSAFNGCSRLVSISMPSNLKSIEFSAFAGCTLLGSTTGGIFEVPNTVKEVGEMPFARCNKITAFVVSTAGTGNLESIDGVLFQRDGEKLILIQFPTGKGGIYTVPDEVTDIANNAFPNCTQLEGIIITHDTKITELGSIILQPYKLSLIDIPKEVRKISDDLVRNASSSNSFERFFETRQSEEPLKLSDKAGTDISLRGNGSGIFYSELYLVKFMSDGKLFDTDLVDYGLTAGKPKKGDPQKDYYAFIEWQNEDGSAYNFSNQITGDTTIVAYFGHSIEFKSEGKRFGEIQLLRLEDVTTKPADAPEHSKGSDYAFLYWAEEGYTTKYTFGNFLEKNTVLVALFKKEVSLPIAIDRVYNGKGQKGTSFEDNDYYEYASGDLEGTHADKYEVKFKLKDPEVAWDPTSVVTGISSIDPDGRHCTVKWEIKKKSVTVTVASETVNFNQAFDPSSWKADEKLSWDPAGPDKPDVIIPSEGVTFYFKDSKVYEAGKWQGETDATDSYKIGVSGLQSGDYDITVEPGTLTCNAILVERPTFNGPYAYDGKKKYAIDSPPDGYIISGNEQTDAGNHDVSVDLEKGYVWSDTGVRSTQTGKLEIAHLSVTIGWTGPANLVYDGDAKVLTPRIVSGVLEEEEDLVGVDCELTPKMDNVNAGDFTFTAFLTGNGSKNYRIANPVSEKYTITPAALPGNMVLEYTVKTYNGQNQLPKVTIISGDKTLDG